MWGPVGCEEVTMDEKKQLSIVIPVYNSADIFPELYQRIAKATHGRSYDLEIIAVLDGCKDRSFEVISGLQQTDMRIRVIEFSRNFGHQAALSAGLQAASGDMVAIMDDDLEDPPEILVSMIEKLREGYDVVYGVRRKRQRSLAHRFLYRQFYRLLAMLVDTKMPYDAGDFCVMRRKVVDALNSMPERNIYLRGLRAWSGFRQVGFDYDRGARFSSGSGYSLKKYFSLAFDAIFSFSYKPLKFVSRIGLLIALASFFFAVRLIVHKLSGKITEVPGWVSLFVSVLFLSGIQLIAIGVIGEYISRIYDEVKQRPKYIIQRTVGFGSGHDTPGPRS